MTISPPESPTRRKILFVSGTRADYGKLKSVIRGVDQDPSLACEIFVTGMHLMRRYGLTWREIEKDGHSELFKFFNQDHATSTHLDRVLANTIGGLSLYVAENPPDMIIVHGDRVEALAGALVGSLNGILVGHIEGGELSGTIDELLRHAITKMAHIHFVSNAQARDRVITMGEYPDKVHIVGSPNIDVMLSSALPSIEEVRSHYEIRQDPYGILLLHPVVGEGDEVAVLVETLLDNLERAGRSFVALYPNNDPGSEHILGPLLDRASSPRLRVLPSMRFEAYLTLLRNAQVLVGNSSSGIHEAPVYGVPSINIGSRQENRFEYESIHSVDFDIRSILRAIDELWGRRFEPSQHFGRGNSSEAILQTLRDPATWDTRVLKQFADSLP